jgi:hypothetical protein
MYNKQTDGHSKFDTIHNDDLGGQADSSFIRVPLYSWDPTDTQARDLVFTWDRIRNSKGPGILAEVLPGEIRCEDNVIRRETAAADRSIVGIEEMLTSSGSTVRRVTITEAKKLVKKGACIVWRPEGTVEDGHYALEVSV